MHLIVCGPQIAPVQNRVPSFFPTSLCGVLVFDSVSIPPPPPPPPPLPLFSHHFVTHHLSHTTLSHTIFHTPLCHTPSFTHHLSHTTLSHTIFHTHLCHTPHTLSFTHHFVTHRFVTHHLSHTIFHIHSFFTHHFSHTIFHTQLCHTPSFTHHFVTHHLSPRHFAWKVWHLLTLTVVLRGRRGTCSHQPSLRVMPLGWLWWRAWARLVARGAAPLCVAGVALGDIDVPFAWQAWRLVTSTVVLRGNLRFAWQAWRLCHWALVHFAWQAWHLATSTFVLRGRRGTGLAPRHFAWQAWHLLTSTVVLRGRRGTCSHQPLFRVAGVALMPLGWLWWCVWARLVARGAGPLCVAGVALGDIDVPFA